MRGLRGLAAVFALAGCDVVFGLERDPPRPDAPTPAERWASVDGGFLHTCGIRLDHTLWCWGRNDSGQLGARENPGDLEVDEPRQVGSAADWEHVSVAFHSACAINAEHRLYCWGTNADGQLATGAIGDNVLEPHLIAGSWSAVSINVHHACAIDTAGALSCWGANDYGQLGTGASSLPQAAPTLVAGGGVWTAVEVGGISSCGLQSDRGLYCWGHNGYGQLGLGPVTGPAVPTRVGTAEYQRLALGEYFACGLETSGKLRCWGRNDVGQVGDATGVYRDLPTPVGQDAITDWTDVVAGTDHACASRSSGQVLCWGSNEYAQLVGQTLPLRTEPQPIEGEWQTIAAGDRSTCVIDRERQLWCAGYGPGGGLGTGTGSKRVPIQLAGSWDEVAAGRAITCARSGTTMSCWGTNHHMAVGDGTSYDRSKPTAIGGSWSSFTVFDHVCAIDSTGRLWCWGSNGIGQLGLGDLADRGTAVMVNAQTWAGVAATLHTCAFDFGGQLSCWGANPYSQMGFPINAPSYSVTPMPTNNGSWFALSAGLFHTCAITPAREVACWGYNGDGELASSSVAFATHVPQIVTLPGTPIVDAVTSGERFSCARAGANVWCWGGNAHGELGNQTVVSSFTPVRLEGAWQTISAGQTHACGVKTDGSLWCWGNNAWGQLGDGTLFERHFPTQVGTDTDWIAVTGGNAHSCARKANKSLWCWGSNIAGELGDGTAWTSDLGMIRK